MHDFRKLRVWQKADELTFDIYGVTRTFPVDERYLLTAQLRSAALSIQSNIAEGFGRGTKADTARFLQMSTASASEVANHLHVSRRLEYLTTEQYGPLSERTEHIRRMLIRLILRLKSQF